MIKRWAACLAVSGMIALLGGCAVPSATEVPVDKLDEALVGDEPGLGEEELPMEEDPVGWQQDFEPIAAADDEETILAPTPAAPEAGLVLETVDIDTTGLLLWKRVLATGMVRNATLNSLSGEVKVDFYKDDSKVETQFHSVSGLAPGGSRAFSLKSTKRADYAKVSVATVE